MRTAISLFFLLTYCINSSLSKKKLRILCKQSEKNYALRILAPLRSASEHSSSPNYALFCTFNYV